uniref:ATP synthase complex subunit 8 n=1 Tax=Boulengerula boulengeri TaxID=260983 RepID=C9D872_BOUBO|nr:ATP synthase F0 subunit 8 [Boulengerula boulengeri]ACS37005.1 ATP synthase F0 subunit 8 [Boulengerula boulengeri]
MPQLNPNPWFMIMIVSWLTLLLILCPKTVKHKPMNTIHHNINDIKHSIPWNWPW